MVFTEPRFLLFLAVVMVVYWSLPRDSWRKGWLLATSYAFYAAWDWRFLGLIWISTLVDHWVGLALGRSEAAVRRRHLVTLSVVVNLGLLGAFKYFDFFVSSGGELLTWLGLGVSHTNLSIVLPVGISFYTFQTMSYTLDIYRRELEPRKNLLDVALFVAFFPQLVAGPIVRARTFLPQLDAPRSFATVPVRACLILLAVGFFKKACLSDNISPLIDPYFDSPEQYDAAAGWIAAVLFVVQIYCDFSGYSDMAIASAGLFGYRLCVNFDFPLLATNITELWNRWHMSFSSWMRDYVYISLGGNRGSLAFVHRNLMITLLLVGLWHGAAWHFVIWGGLNGLALGFHREWSRRWGKRASIPAWIGVVLTFLWFSLSGVFFRTPDLARGITTLRACLLFESPGEQSLAVGLLLGILGVAALLHLSEYWLSITERLERTPAWAFAALSAVAVHLLLLTTQRELPPFIYFQF